VVALRGAAACCWDVVGEPRRSAGVRARRLNSSVDEVWYLAFKPPLIGATNARRHPQRP
jgi:hypothetical protein